MTFVKSHGMKDTRPYSIWNSMKNRCHCKTDKDFPRYGGRGITVCESWQRFEGFWADMAEGYDDHLQLDRRENSLGYSKTNCKWSTPTEQQRNRTNNVIVDTLLGPMVMSEAAEIFGLSYGAVKMRYQSGWPAHRLLEPVGKYKRAKIIHT